MKTVHAESENVYKEAEEIAELVKRGIYGVNKVAIGVSFPKFAPVLHAIVDRMGDNYMLVKEDGVQSNVDFAAYSILYLKVSVGRLRVFARNKISILEWDRRGFPTATLTDNDRDRLSSRLSDINVNAMRSSQTRREKLFGLAAKEDIITDEGVEEVVNVDEYPTSLEKYLKEYISKNMALADKYYGLSIHIDGIIKDNKWQNPEDTIPLREFQKRNRVLDKVANSAIISYKSLYYNLLQQRAIQALSVYTSWCISQDTFVSLVLGHLATDPLWKHLRIILIERPGDIGPRERQIEEWILWQEEMQQHDLLWVKDEAVAAQLGMTPGYYRNKKSEFRAKRDDLKNKNFYNEKDS